MSGRRKESKRILVLPDKLNRQSVAIRVIKASELKQKVKSEITGWCRVGSSMGLGHIFKRFVDVRSLGTRNGLSELEEIELNSSVCKEKLCSIPIGGRRSLKSCCNRRVLEDVFWVRGLRKLRKAQC